MKLKQIIPVVAISFAMLTSCKKKVDPTPTPPIQPGTGTRTELSRDSIFLYAKQVYLWSDALPSYETFNPRKYTSASTDLENYENELFDITQYKINPTTGKPFEYFADGTDTKYSYIQDITTKNPTAYIQEQKSSVDLDGNGNDFGVKLGAYYLDATKTTFYLFATAVYENSPAYNAGMIRSNRITKINGVAVGANLSNEVNNINSAFNSTDITIEGIKYLNGVSNGTFAVTLKKTVYKSSPVFATKVFTAGSKKIGYLAYARFSSLTNSKADFDAAFNTFSTEGVTDLIIDLRYNGGGYVNTAEYLINQIAPSSANGKVMFAEYYNALMQSNGATILKNQPLLDANGKVQFQNGQMITYANIDYSVTANTENFVKTGPLTDVTNIVFIVSGGTASASELVINSLRPYMNVKLVGVKSYGKPVGFFPITIENKYDVYYSLFQTKNSLGQGDYFDGFTPDVVDTYDDPFYNFGDAKENYIAKSINLLAPGTVVTSLNKTMSINGKSVSVQSLSPMKPVVGGNEFVGMIDTKHTLKK